MVGSIGLLANRIHPLVEENPCGPVCDGLGDLFAGTHYDLPGTLHALFVASAVAHGSDHAVDALDGDVANLCRRNPYLDVLVFKGGVCLGNGDVLAERELPVHKASQEALQHRTRHVHGVVVASRARVDAGSVVLNLLEQPARRVGGQHGVVRLDEFVGLVQRARKEHPLGCDIGLTCVLREWVGVGVGAAQSFAGSFARLVSRLVLHVEQERRRCVCVCVSVVSCGGRVRRRH